MKDTYLVHIMSSMCAGLVGATMATPADVIKTRIMNQPTDQFERYCFYLCIDEISIWNSLFILGVFTTNRRQIALWKQCDKKAFGRYTRASFQLGSEWDRGPSPFGWVTNRYARPWVRKHSNPEKAQMCLPATIIIYVVVRLSPYQSKTAMIFRNHSQNHIFFVKFFFCKWLACDNRFVHLLIRVTVVYFLSVYQCQRVN